MENIGTWNSNLAMVYLLFFSFPFLLLIMREIAAAWPRPKTVVRTQVKHVQLPVKTVYKTNTKTKIVFKNTTRKKRRSNSRPTTKQRSKINPAAHSKPKPIVLTPVQIDASDALCHLGMKKSEAKQAVIQKYNPDKHKTFEPLFRDCLS